MKTAETVLERLEAAGHKAYFVGGCVRDILRRQHAPVATDIDVATSAKPNEMAKVFGDFELIETGIKHGTVTVLVPVDRACVDRDLNCACDEDEQVAPAATSADRLPVEITTFRYDGKYSDGRHPDEVRFVGSIEEDLARRDFTINAIAMDLKGEIVDPFGGIDDLDSGIVRSVGDPGERFREDGLRILRALRFASVLGFSVEEETSEALHRNRDLLRKIAVERIFTELKKLLAGEGAGRILREYADVIEVVIPELVDMDGFEQHNPYHRYVLLEHCIRALELIETKDDDREYMKLAALLHDVGKPSTFTMDEEGVGHFYGHPGAGERICRDIFTRLHSDRFTRDRVCLLIKYHDLLFEKNDRLLKRWLRKFGPRVLLEILALKRADNIATGNATDELIDKFDDIRNRILQLIEEDACFRREHLAINGRDLIEQGMDEGPGVGMILDWLVDGVIDGRIQNDRQALLKEAKQLGQSREYNE